MKDLYNREINYLRISVTDLCNLRCRYCMPEKGVSKLDHDEILRLEEIYELAKAFVSAGVNKIRITGGEPLVRKGILDLVQKIAGIQGINDFAMTTNGILLKEYASDLKNAGLHRVNVSLDTLNHEKYYHITKGGNLDSVLEGIEAAEKAGLKPVKLNTVLIGGFNDDETVDFVNLTRNRNMDIRFIELMPIGQAKDWVMERFLSNATVLEKVKELQPVENPDFSSPARLYRLPDGIGRVGLISPLSCKFCDRCNRIRLTSDGKIKLCLHSDEEIDLKTPLRNGENIEKLVHSCIINKPKEHYLEEGRYISREMTAIGG